MIDAHQHFWNYDPERDAWITEEMKAIRKDFTPDDLLHELKANDMDGSVLVQADPSENETAFLVGLAEKYEFIKGVLGWVDLTNPNAGERLDFYKKSAPKIKGFRHVVQSEPDDNFLLREDFCNGVSRLKDFDFTYDILIYPRQLPAAIRFVEKFPDQKFVIDHIAKPNIKEGITEPWATHIKEIAKHPNVHCKISGMVTEANWDTWDADTINPYLDVVFEAFGAGRLMFGSDWPVCLVAAQYSQVKKLVTDYLQIFSNDDQQDVMGGNAVKFYHLY